MLVASPHLGGISATISAYESLKLRGYDVDAMLCFEDGKYENWKYFHRWCEERDIAFGATKPPPSPNRDHMADMTNMLVYYDAIGHTAPSNDLTLYSVVKSLQQRHQARWKDLTTSASRARNKFWWPFVQHAHVQKDSDVMIIDSAHGDNFSIFREETADSTRGKAIGGETSALVPTFDGSASWWTQCLGHANTEINLAAAEAAGRYGHVIFPTASHAPALHLTERLLATVGKGWATRVFFSDDGSTGMEVGIKMALHKTAKRLQAGRRPDASHERVELGILGLKGSYHGDTIGAMDASEPSVYSRSVEWYRGRGFWLDPPTLRIEKGKPIIRMDGEQWEGNTNLLPPLKFDNLQQVYDVETRLQTQPAIVKIYNELIADQLEHVEADKGFSFGAIVLEPIVMGAGGMLFVDPLFQRLLVDYARQKMQLPVVFDEVFVGLHRLGPMLASSFLGVKPDVACFAKILTGGLLPMSVTLASDAIFRSYLGEEKQEALLHGHSYTAQPVGCNVALKTLDILARHDSGDESWNAARSSWSLVDAKNAASETAAAAPFSVWDKTFVNKMSGVHGVDGAMALGTVLVIYLRDAENAGYQSTAAIDLLKQLRHPASADDLAIHARPLGNTVYFMSSVDTPRETLAKIEKALWSALSTEEMY